MAYPNDLNIFLLATKQLTNSFGLGLDGASRGFLHQDVAILAMLEGKEYQIHSLLQAHNEAGHLGLGEGDGVAMADLVNPQGDDTATAAHHIAIAGAADLSAATVAALGHGNLLLNSLGDAHGIDGIGGFVCGEADDALDTGIDGGIEGVVGTNDIGLDGFHREELARGHLLEGSSMEDIVHTLHSVFQRALVAHITNVELDLTGHFGHTGLILVAHVVLLLLVAGEDADLANVGAEETV